MSIQLSSTAAATFVIVKAASLLAYQNIPKLYYIMPQTTARKVLKKQNETHLGLFSTGEKKTSSRPGECYEQTIVFFTTVSIEYHLIKLLLMNIINKHK